MIWANFLLNNIIEKTINIRYNYTIVEKLLLKHRVLRHEVKEVLENKPKFRFVEKGHRKNENVYLAMG